MSLCCGVEKRYQQNKQNIFGGKKKIMNGFGINGMIQPHPNSGCVTAE